MTNFKNFLTEAKKQTKLDRISKANLRKYLGDTSSEAIRYYKGGSFEINSSLRNDEKTSEVNNRHMYILDKLTNNPVNHELTVFRGIHPELEPHKWEVGHVLHDKGYTSTTLLASLAAKFAHADEDRRKNRYIARIHLKPEDKGHYLDHNDATHNYTEEKELLLHRGTSLKITNITHGYTTRNNNKVHFVDMEVHHQEDHGDKKPLSDKQNFSQEDKIAHIFENPKISNKFKLSHDDLEKYSTFDGHPHYGVIKNLHPKTKIPQSFEHAMVKKSPNMVDIFPNPSKSVQTLIISHYPAYIRSINNLHQTFQNDLVKINPENIKYIKKPSYETQKYVADKVGVEKLRTSLHWSDQVHPDIAKEYYK